MTTPPDPADRWRPRARWLSLACAAGVAGGLAVGLLEAAWVAFRARGAGLLAVPVVLALDVLAGLALAAAGAALVTLAAADPRVRAAAARAWARRAGTPAERAAFAATALAFLAAAGLAVAGGVPLVLAIAARIANEQNEPLLQAPAVLAWAGTLALAALPFQRGLARAFTPLARRFPRVVPWIPAVPIAAGLALAGRVLRDPALRAALELPTLGAILLLAATIIAAVRLLERAPGTPDAARPGGAPTPDAPRAADTPRPPGERPAAGLAARRPVATGLVAAGTTGLAVLALLLASGPRSRSAIDADGLTAGFLLGTLERATDRDGDGISPFFGGLDCDDRDPAVHAGAVDYPGNGRDEDCDGADAKPMVIDFGPAHAGILPAARTARNVLLVTIDALRADHVGAYGYRARPTTPRFDAFAAGATLFERAYSPGAATVRVMPALLAGVHPLGVRWEPAGKSVEMSLSHVTIAELLAEKGFATASVDLAQPRSRPGFEQGFKDVFGRSAVPDEVYKVFKAGNAVASADTAISWLDARGPKPFFLWLHFIDPHHPYHPHPETAAFGDEDIGLYDGEVAYTDAQLGRVLDHVAKLGLADTTLVIVTSDHGEHFGEHRERFHAKDVWEESIRVPLAMRLPKAPPRRITTPVTTLDVAWTIYDLLGVSASPTALRSRHGMSLAGALVTGTEPPPRLIVAASFDRPPDAVTRVAAIRWPLSIREDARSGARTCYDLAADPGQSTNVMDSRRECGAIVTELAAWRVAVMGERAKAPPPRPPKKPRPEKRPPPPGSLAPAPPPRP